MCLAIPGLVLSIEGSGLQRQGLVRFGDIERRVNLGFCPDAAVDDYVVTHVGCAIRVLDQEEAQRLLALLVDLASPEADDALS